jgi:hypothetical protein
VTTPSGRWGAQQWAGFDDPILRLLPPLVPDVFRALPPKERAWRARLYLMVWALGLPEDYAWSHALQDGSVAPEARALVASVADVAIIEQVRLRREHDAETVLHELEDDELRALADEARRDGDEDRALQIEDIVWMRSCLGPPR